jgi:hypothetical protein
MNRAADELEKLPFGSPVNQLINDYQRMRDICRKIKLP